MPWSWIEKFNTFYLCCVIQRCIHCDRRWHKYSDTIFLLSLFSLGFFSFVKLGGGLCAIPPPCISKNAHSWRHIMPKWRHISKCPLFLFCHLGYWTKRTFNRGIALEQRDCSNYSSTKTIIEHQGINDKVTRLYQKKTLLDTMRSVRNVS